MLALTLNGHSTWVDVNTDRPGRTEGLNTDRPGRTAEYLILLSDFIRGNAIMMHRFHMLI